MTYVTEHNLTDLAIERWSRLLAGALLSLDAAMYA